MPTSYQPQRIEVEAETLEEARREIESQIPEGLSLLSETIISDGKPKTIKGIADTTEAAFAKAQAQIPHTANVIERKQLSAPQQRAIIVEAFTEYDAKAAADKQMQDTDVLKSLKLARAGRKGFLGIAKKPHRYEGDILRQAVVQIVYGTKARIVAEIGEPSVPPRTLSNLPATIISVITRDTWDAVPALLESWDGDEMLKCDVCGATSHLRDCVRIGAPPDKFKEQARAAGVTRGIIIKCASCSKSNSFLAMPN